MILRLRPGAGGLALRRREKPRPGARILFFLLGAQLFGPAFGVEPGREGLLFSALRGDARAGALGVSAAAMLEGSSAQFANPAGAIFDRSYSFGLTHLQWIEGFFGETVAAQMPISHEGVLGVSAFVFTHEALPVTTEALPDGSGALSDMLAVEVTLLGAQWMTDTIGIGANIRVLHERFGSLRTNAFAVDVGAVRTLTPDLTVGAAVRGLGRVIRAADVRDPLPLLVSLGARFEWPEQPVRVYAGGYFSGYGPSAGGLGVELGEWKGGLVRMTAQLREREGFEVAVGIGAHRDMWKVDYAFLPVSNIGFGHRISLSINFAAPRQR